MTGTRRLCDTGCRRPAVSLTPAPWQLAFCQVHDDLLHEAEAQHWKWALSQTLDRYGQIATPQEQPNR